MAQIGAVKRLSVAVLVDSKYVTQQDGTQSFNPWMRTSWPKSGSLPSGPWADEERGDAIEVTSIAFGDPAEGTDSSALDRLRGTSRCWASRSNAVIVLLFLFFVVRPWFWLCFDPSGRTDRR